MEPFPASPEPEYRPDAKGPAPASVQNAVKLIWVRVALSLIATVVTFTMIDDLVDDTLASASGAGVSESAARASVIGVLIFSFIIGVALTALFAYFIGKGANWARIVYTVLAVLSILSSVFTLGGQPALLLILGVVGLLLTVATLVLLFRPESNAYFKKA